MDVTGRHTNRSDTGKERRLAENEGVPRATRPRRAPPLSGRGPSNLYCLHPLGRDPASRRSSPIVIGLGYLFIL